MDTLASSRKVAPSRRGSGRTRNTPRLDGVSSRPEGTDDAAEASRAAQAGALRPRPTRRNSKRCWPSGARPWNSDRGEWELLALGMAEFRNGHFAAAAEALLAAAKAGKDPSSGGHADFYRAMSLFRQGKNDEARKLATEAAATMGRCPATSRTRSPAARPPTT